MKGVPSQSLLIFKGKLPVQQQGKLGSHPSSSAFQHAALDRGTTLSQPRLTHL